MIESGSGNVKTGMISFDEAVKQIVDRDKRFSPKAFYFLREALDFTQSRVSEEGHGAMRHVSGAELLEGFKDFALEQFGPMAATVLREWGLKNGFHVGEMVYALIDVGCFSQEEKDSINDFKGFMAFKTAFEKPFEPKES